MIADTPRPSPQRGSIMIRISPTPLSPGATVRYFRQKRGPVTGLVALVAGMALAVVPTAFAASPTVDSAAAQAGTAFAANCADCHGATGHGDGPMVKDESWRDI